MRVENTASIQFILAVIRVFHCQVPDGDQRQHHLPAGPGLGLHGGGQQPPQHRHHQARGVLPDLQPDLSLPHHHTGRIHTGTSTSMRTREIGSDESNIDLILTLFRLFA